MSVVSSNHGYAEGDPILWLGLRGEVTKVRLMGDRNFWVTMDDTGQKILFSIRADGQWRAVGFPANLEGLCIAPINAKVLV